MFVQRNYIQAFSGPTPANCKVRSSEDLNACIVEVSSQSEAYKLILTIGIGYLLTQ